MMDRRKFVNFLALLAAGTAARPEQVAAFEHYYNVNTPAAGEPFIAIDDIMLCGLAGTSLPLRAEFFRDREHVLPLAINAFGGVVRWAAMPDQKIICNPASFRWKIESVEAGSSIATKFKEDFGSCLNGHISYIDQDGIRVVRKLFNASSSLIA